jgi:hypothetical protein
MASGTIFMMGERSCEVVVTPETTANIIAAREAVEQSGFVVESEGRIVGNFVVKMTEGHDLQQLSTLITGDVFGHN